MTKSMWIVCLPCGKRFPMVGKPQTQDEALASASKIWPEATVE